MQLHFYVYEALKLLLYKADMRLLARAGARNCGAQLEI